MESEYRFDVMTPRVYAFGALILLLGFLGVYLMITKPPINPLFIIFFYSIPSNCAIAIFPHEPVLILYGKTVNLMNLTLFATLGTIVAAYLDYRFFAPVLNLSYSVKYKSTRFYRKAYYWFYRIPFITLIIAGFTPIPFFPFKFMVYSSKYSLKRYLAAVAVGRFPKYYLLAYAGFKLQIPDWLIFASFAGMILIVYHRKIAGWLARSLRPLIRAIKGEKVTENMKAQKNITFPLAVRMAARTAANLVARKPLCIALEVTHNCTANCRHCDKGPKVEDNAIGALEYRKICDELGPAMIQIAGGEPLKRDDLPEIVRALYRPNRPPMLVLVTNASLLTEDKYLELRDAGIRQFSISIDFPDSRHDQFRRIPGLFEKLDSLIPRLNTFGNGDITINTCITRENYPEIKSIARLAARWGVKLNFSAYTDLRTRDQSLNLRHPADTNILSGIIDEIYSGNGEYSSVMTSQRVLRRFNRFFINGCRMPNCRTGRRFLIVNPDGRLTPCAMFIEERFRNRRELVERFADSNSCDGCYISIRANTEKSPWELLTDNMRALRISKRISADISEDPRAAMAESQRA